jgi:hypothetical protein
MTMTISILKSGECFQTDSRVLEVIKVFFFLHIIIRIIIVKEVVTILLLLRIFLRVSLVDSVKERKVSM